MKESRVDRGVEKKKRGRKKGTHSQEVASFQGDDANQTRGMSQAWQGFYARVKASVKE